eukprot:714612-Amphidinium_carterae.1
MRVDSSLNLSAPVAAAPRVRDPLEGVAGRRPERSLKRPLRLLVGSAQAILASESSQLCGCQPGGNCKMT